MKKYAFFLVIMFVFTALFSGCKSEFNFDSLSEDAEIYNDTVHKVGYQLEDPEKGEEIAIIHTAEGDIYLRFFPEAAPKAVENFKGLANDKSLDGIKFYRVVNNFVIQGGINDKTKPGGNSFFGAPFKDEFSDRLFNIRGSVAMANAGADGNTSEFFINQRMPQFNIVWSDIETKWRQLPDLVGTAYNNGQLDNYISKNYISGVNYSKITDDVKKLYDEQGGNITLDGCFNAFDRGHTVFAQVFKGMDTVDRIAGMNTTQNQYPDEPVIITGVEITRYE